jgi:hypothetical protein
MSAAFRFVEPVWRNYIMYVDMESREGNADAARYLHCWQSLTPEEQRLHMPEQLCELASVHSWDVVGWVSRQMFAEGNAQAAMCMSVNRSRVLQKVAEYAAADAANYKDRELFAKTAGLMPVASRGGGGSVPVTIFNAPMATSNAVAGVRSESGPVHASGLRDMDSEIVELSRVMQQGGTACRAEREPAEPDDDEDEDKTDDDYEEDT